MTSNVLTLKRYLVEIQAMMLVTPLLQWSCWFILGKFSWFLKWTVCHYTHHQLDNF
jgi:hypothetical protein